MKTERFHLIKLNFIISKFLLIIFCFSFVLTGCVTVKSVERKYSEINKVDGVNKSEGLVIAQHFISENKFNNEFSLSGYLYTSEDSRNELLGIIQKFNNTWLFVFNSKLNICMYDVLQQFLVVVDKNDGEVRYASIATHSFWTSQWSFQEVNLQTFPLKYKEYESKEKFDQAVNDWKNYLNANLKFSSRSSDYIDCEPFQKIVSFGPQILPVLIEKIKEGDFMLWYAVRDISKINLRKSEFESEQQTAEKYIRWLETKN